MQRMTVWTALLTVSLGWWLMGSTLAAGENVTDMEQTFLQQAAGDGMAEVTLVNMAVKRAAHPDVQRFGQRMVSSRPDAPVQRERSPSSPSVAGRDRSRYTSPYEHRCQRRSVRRYKRCVALPWEVPFKRLLLRVLETLLSGETGCVYAAKGMS